MMKKYKMKFLIVILCGIIIFVTGCTQDKVGKVGKVPVAGQSQSQTLDLVATSLEEKSDTITDTTSQTSSSDTEDKEIINQEIDKVIEIKEKMFVAQTNDIYVNYEDYIGKTIKLEGIFRVDYYEEVDITYYSVIRYGPGCCGYDANAGFEISGEMEYPEANEWVEAIGGLEMYEEDGINYLLLKLSELTVLTERGEEYVYQ